jgi:hypothetical protein
MDFGFGVPFGGAISNGLESFFHPEKGWEEAQKELQKYFQQAMGYQQPFQQNGVNQGQILTDAQKQLMNPSEMLNKWTSGYETSPYAHQLMDQSKSSGLDAASSMGLMGSSPALSSIQNSAGNIMQKDRESYLKDMMDKYMKGIGIGENIYNQGSATAANMGTQAMQAGQGAGTAAFGQANAPGNMISNMMNMAMQAYMASHGGGMGKMAGGAGAMA